MAAVLAIFKAGGVYLPVEPELPANRIAKMALTRAECKLVLTETGSTATLEGGELASVPGIQTLFVDAAYQEGHKEDDLGIAVGPDQLAYIYFTSGSTGEPKGAMCEQGRSRGHVGWRARRWPASQSPVCGCVLLSGPGVTTSWTETLEPATLVRTEHRNRSGGMEAGVPERFFARCVAETGDSAGSRLATWPMPRPSDWLDVLESGRTESFQGEADGAEVGVGDEPAERG